MDVKLTEAIADGDRIRRESYLNRSPLFLVVMMIGWTWALWQDGLQGLEVIPFTYGSDPMIRSVFFAAIFCYLECLLDKEQPRPTRSETFLIPFLAVALEGLAIQSRPASWDLAMCFQSLGVGLGTACLLGLVWRVLFTPRGRPKLPLALVSTAAFLLLYPRLSSIGHRVVSNLTLEVYDLRAYQMDAIAGFQPSLFLCHLCTVHPSIYLASHFVYSNLPAVLIVAIVLSWRPGQGSYFNVQAATLYTGIFGMLLYRIYPACGIYWASQSLGHSMSASDTPVILKALPPLLRLPEAALRNCSPSLHVSWALIAYFSVRHRSGVMKFVAGSFVVLTMIAAVPCGGHYLTDYVTSFPLSLAICAITASRTKFNHYWRWICGFAGGLGCIGFLLGQRLLHVELTANPLLKLSIEILLISGCFWAEHRLATSSVVGPPLNHLDLDEVV